MANPNVSPPGEIPKHLHGIVAEIGSTALTSIHDKGEIIPAGVAAAQCPFAKGLDEVGFVEFVGEHLA